MATEGLDVPFPVIFYVHTGTTLTLKRCADMLWATTKKPVTALLKRGNGYRVLLFYSQLQFCLEANIIFVEEDVPALLTKFLFLLGRCQVIEIK